MREVRTCDCVFAECSRSLQVQRPHAVYELPRGKGFTMSAFLMVLLKCPSMHVTWMHLGNHRSGCRRCATTPFISFGSLLYGQVLCGGSRKEKMMAIFNLFHRSEGVGITVRDIATFTTSAFRVMYKLQPSLEGEV